MTEPAVAAAVVEGAPDYRRFKRLTLLVGLIVALLSGVSDGIFGETAACNLLTPCALAVLIAVWCHYDAAQRGYDLSTPLRLLVLLLSPIGIPVYAFRTRGVSGFKLLGWSLLFVLTIGVCAGIAAGVTAWITGVEWPY